MLSKSLMLLRRMFRRLGVRVVLMTLLALVAAVVAPVFDPLIPDELKDRFDRGSVLPVLDILASSMLATTTFSLGVMVSSFQAAAGQATPRAYRILMQDGTTQMVLATFVSTFLFSLTAIVMFRANFYSEAAAVVIFGLTVLSIAAIIIAILRWIDHLSKLGSMDHTLGMVEDAAEAALYNAASAPCLGAHPLDPDVEPPIGARPLGAPISGYVQFINMPGLHEALEEHDARVHITAPPGTYVLKGAALGYLTAKDATLTEKIGDYFTLGLERTLEQDARFGLLVMAEVAARALSPGVNDPGTAIDVTHRVQKLLWEHAENAPEPQEVRYPRAFVPRIAAADLLRDGYDVIIRDGAGRIEVMRQILHCLSSLKDSSWDELAHAAADTRRYAVHHADIAITVQIDRSSIAELARQTETPRQNSV